MSTTQPSPDTIAEAAYFLWLEEGCPEGRDEEHWHRAHAALSTPRRKRAAPRVPAVGKKPAPAKPRSRKAPPAGA